MTDAEIAAQTKLWEVQWTEYERGWGSRPDGKARFLTKDAAEAHRKEAFDAMPDYPAGTAPDEYTQPGQAYEVDATPEEVHAVRAALPKTHWHSLR